MNQHKFVEGALEYYADNGLYPGDGARWEDAHYPRPKGDGKETVPLLWEHHQIQGLLQSEEENRRCFFPADAKKFLLTTSFLQSYFELWDIYEKWAGTAPFKDPQTGETALLTREEATALGWIHVHAGKAAYINPVTGGLEQLTPEEAATRGWRGKNTGKAPYRNPQTGEIALLTKEEAAERGWKGKSSGKAPYRDPQTGKTALLTKEEAATRGWVGVNQGLKHKYRTCPHCGKLGSGPVMNRHHFDNCVHKANTYDS